jgi:UDP-glucose 4-epimerase
MQEHNVKNIIFSSSASTYASSNIPPISETAIQETSSPYGTTKYLIEKILKDLAKFS